MDDRAMPGYLRDRYEELARRKGWPLAELTAEQRESGQWRLVWRRRICWPNPDATCLEGGCMYCENGRFRDLAAIEKYARGAGVIPNRGRGEQEALRAWERGLANTFFESVPVIRRARMLGASQRWALR